VEVNPKFHEDVSNFEDKIPFEECIELYSTEKTVVKTPDYLLLTHNGRTFKLVYVSSPFFFMLIYFHKQDKIVKINILHRTGKGIRGPVSHNIS
jgi:hypothetical protein